MTLWNEFNDRNHFNPFASDEIDELLQRVSAACIRWNRSTRSASLIDSITTAQMISAHGFNQVAQFGSLIRSISSLQVKPLVLQTIQTIVIRWNRWTSLISLIISHQVKSLNQPTEINGCTWDYPFDFVQFMQSVGSKGNYSASAISPTRVIYPQQTTSLNSFNHFPSDAIAERVPFGQIKWNHWARSMSCTHQISSPHMQLLDEFNNA
jgi:hypothetical protein